MMYKLTVCQNVAKQTNVLYHLKDRTDDDRVVECTQESALIRAVSALRVELMTTVL